MFCDNVRHLEGACLFMAELNDSNVTSLGEDEILTFIPVKADGSDGEPFDVSVPAGTTALLVAQAEKAGISTEELIIQILRDRFTPADGVDKP